MKDRFETVDGSEFLPEKPKKKMTILIKPRKIGKGLQGRGFVPLSQYGIGVNSLPLDSKGIQITVTAEKYIELRKDRSLIVREV